MSAIAIAWKAFSLKNDCTYWETSIGQKWTLLAFGLLLTIRRLSTMILHTVNGDAICSQPFCSFNANFTGPNCHWYAAILVFNTNLLLEIELLYFWYAINLQSACLVERIHLLYTSFMVNLSTLLFVVRSVSPILSWEDQYHY